MKEKKHLDALYSFEDEEIVEKTVTLEAIDGETDGEEPIQITETYTKPSELRQITYKIEDNSAQMLNYNSIIESSKKTLKEAKKDYAAAKKEYDSKSFGALVYDILTFLGIFFSVYFLVKWLGERESETYEILLYVSLIATACFLFVAFCKNLKLKPLKQKMKHAKDLMRNSKTWIEESEREMKIVEQENSSLKRQRKNM